MAKSINQGNVDKAREHWLSRAERRPLQEWRTAADITIAAAQKGERGAIPIKLRVGQ